jgi:hypothetical protein
MTEPGVAYGRLPGVAYHSREYRRDIGSPLRDFPGSRDEPHDCRPGFWPLVAVRVAIHVASVPRRARNHRFAAPSAHSETGLDLPPQTLPNC